MPSTSLTHASTDRCARCWIWRRTPLSCVIELFSPLFSFSNVFLHPYTLMWLVMVMSVFVAARPFSYLRVRVTLSPHHLTIPLYNFDLVPNSLDTARMYISLQVSLSNVSLLFPSKLRAFYLSSPSTGLLRKSLTIRHCCLHRHSIFRAADLGAHRASHLLTHRHYDLY